MTMRVALAVLTLAIAGSPVLGQTPPAAAPAQTPPAAQPPRPFPEGAKVAYVNIQRIANESAEGKAATSKVAALNQKKVAELNEKNKALQAAEQKLVQSGTVLSDDARLGLEKEIERLRVDVQRFTQDAQAEVQDLQETLQAEFQRKLMPVISQVSSDKGLHMVFSQFDAGLVWADTGLDITSEVIARFDASGGGTTAAPPAGAPPAAAPPANNPPGQQ